MSALWAAFVWGFAEASFFFVVPDVLLTLIGWALHGTVHRHSTAAASILLTVWSAFYARYWATI
jgi:hypothetical protein